MDAYQNYYNIWSGSNLMDTITLLVTILISYVFMIMRVFLPVTAIEAVIWMFIIETYFLTYIIMKYKLRDKHRSAVQGKSFCFTGVWRDHTYYEKMLFGVEKWYEVEVDWTDEMINELFETSYFKSLKSEIINQMEIENLQNPMSWPKDDKGEFDPSKLPYRNFKIGDITDDMKEQLKKYKIYIGKLFEEYCYSDSKISFDRLCLITEWDIAKALKTKKSSAVHEGYPVDIDQVECAFNQIGFVLPEVPVFFLAWTENITKKILEPSLKAQEIVYIEMKVLEKFVYTLRAFSQQAAMQIKQEQTKADMYYGAWDEALQDIETINLHKVLGSKDLEYIKMEQKAKKGNQYKSLFYLMIAVCIIIIIILIVFIVNSGSNSNIVKDIEESATTSFKYINSIIKCRI